MGGFCLSWCLVTSFALAAQAAPVRSDRPNEVAFPAQQARFVRFVIHASSSSQPCIDELEVYGPDGDRNLALDTCGAKATASSYLPGHPIHQIAHLNDGVYGNRHSWIAAGMAEEWAQIELPTATEVSRVVFSRDRNREYADRVPIHFEVLLSMDGQQWKQVKKVATTAALVALRRHFGDFAGIVPSPPPPPRVASNGVVIPQDGPQDLAVPKENEKRFANLALNANAKPGASSVISGYAIHQTRHLNDGLAGNQHSWISQEDPSWAQIDLGNVYWIYQVAFASDDSRQHSDRAATSFCILTATDYNQDTSAATWQPVYRQASGSPVHARREFSFPPVQARWVRIAVDTSSRNEVRIDEIEVYGSEDPIPEEQIGPIPAPMLVRSVPNMEVMLREAFLGEEHAWLKTYGRADLSPRLVPYNGRVQEYPRHVEDDRLPLPPLSAAPILDGNLDDPCWAGASQGVVRVVYPFDFDQSPLVTCSVAAGRQDGHLVLGIEASRLLSGHLAVVSSSDGQGCGVVAYTKDGLVFNTYVPEGRSPKLENSIPVEGSLNDSLTCCEFRLPLDLFPECEEQGIRIGLGMGGKHTPAEGRPVNFVFSNLSVSELQPCVNRTFRVRLSAAADAGAVRVRGNAPGMSDGLSLKPDRPVVISIPVDPGPIGPQYELSISDDRGETYSLHLFRYDPLRRTLALMDEMIDRFAEKGLEVEQERLQLADFRLKHEQLRAEGELAAERETFFAARLAKRRLFLREPDLAPMENILCVKRRPFEPSHNYSVCFDSAYRPGGGICTVKIPRMDGRFEPAMAESAKLFDAGSGIARTPMADFDLGKIYFGYRPSEDGYYHVMSINTDGSGLEQLTDGPFHDYWPCPLPDGGLAFITSRCKCRALCWRPQALVLFRMDTDGGNIRPLSLANLTEWAPSVMNDGRIIWTRWEYNDKGADFGHTLWSIRPDGTYPELIFGNTIIQPNGYANGREVPGTKEICCTLISHFGDLNGPIALVDVNRGRFNPQAITSITPEVPWPGQWPKEECFRDPVPLARDYFLCSHAPRGRFGIFVIDRFGNRELIHADPEISIMCPTIFAWRRRPPAITGEAMLAADADPDEGTGEMFLADVYRGLSPNIERGRVKYIRIAQEVRAGLDLMPDGQYRQDHPVFQDWYATPVHKVSGPHGWPAYIAKTSWGIVPVEDDGSAHFYAPAGKTLYFQALDEDFNELQRMRSVVQLQAGEKRSCIGCHEDRHRAPPDVRNMMARGPRQPELPSWGARPFSYQQIVQPVWDAKCISCHDADDKQKINLTGSLDADKVPASYRTLISQGWVHHVDCGYNSGGCEKLQPLTFGTLKSKLWNVLEAGHYEVELTTDEIRRVKCWTDFNCPLWPDYIDRMQRPGPEVELSAK